MANFEQTCRFEANANASYLPFFTGTIDLAGFNNMQWLWAADVCLFCRGAAVSAAVLQSGAS